MSSNDHYPYEVLSFSQIFLDKLKCSYVLLCAFLKEGAISSLKEWLSDSAIGSNPVLRLIAGIVFMHEQDYNEALKHTHTGGTLDLLVFPLYPARCSDFHF
jgi:hypothetical protein